MTCKEKASYDATPPCTWELSRLQQRVFKQGRTRILHERHGCFCEQRVHVCRIARPRCWDDCWQGPAHTHEGKCREREKGGGGGGEGEGGERNTDVDTKTNTRVRAHACTHTHTPHTQTQSYLQGNTQADCMNATAACARSECMFATSHGPAAGMTEACTQVHTHIQVCHTRINTCTTHMNMCVHFHTWAHIHVCVRWQIKIKQPSTVLVWTCVKCICLSMHTWMQM